MLSQRRPKVPDASRSIHHGIWHPLRTCRPLLNLGKENEDFGLLIGGCFTLFGSIRCTGSGTTNAGVRRKTVVVAIFLGELRGLSCKALFDDTSPI